jgi:hypothetical protein
MFIAHWLVGVLIFVLLGAFIWFAFRQGMAVKPDRNKNPDDWTRTARGGGDGGPSSDAGHVG